MEIKYSFVFVILLIGIINCSLPQRSSLRFNEVTEDFIAPHSISTSKLQQNIISTQHLQNGAVTNDKLDSYSVDSRVLKDNSVTTRNAAIDLVRIYFSEAEPITAVKPRNTHTSRDFPFQIANQDFLGLLGQQFASSDDDDDVTTRSNDPSLADAYVASSQAAGPGVILGWYPTRNGHLLRYQADRALRTLQCYDVDWYFDYLTGDVSQFVDGTRIVNNEGEYATSNANSGQSDRPYQTTTLVPVLDEPVDGINNQHRCINCNDGADDDVDACTFSTTCTNDDNNPIDTNDACSVTMNDNGWVTLDGCFIDDETHYHDLLITDDGYRDDPNTQPTGPGLDQIDDDSGLTNTEDDDEFVWHWESSGWITACAFDPKCVYDVITQNSFNFADFANVWALDTGIPVTLFQRSQVPEAFHLGRQNPDRCGSYTSVGDVTNPQEGTPVWSPNIERIAIDDEGKVSVYFFGKGVIDDQQNPQLAQNTVLNQPPIDLTVVVLLNQELGYGHRSNQ